MIALIESYRAGLLTVKNLKTNVIAGIVVGVVALPLALAFAIASGVKPEQGIYTAIIAGLLVGIFGGTRTQISGPTGAFVVILAGITAKYGFVGLQIATVFAGVILCVMGFLRLGNALKFIPYPVVVGFTSGIATIIFVGQWKDFFGLPVTMQIDTSFYQKLLILVSSIQELDSTTSTISLLSLGILIFGRRYIKRVPLPLLAMLFATVVQWYFSFSTVSTIGSVFGAIPQSLPSFTMPDFRSMDLACLIGPACTIALLGAFESLLSAAVADSLCTTKHNSNQELLGQGLANIVAPFFGGFASTGAIARTVINIKNGGNCLLAAVVHSLVLLSVLLFFAPYASYIPLCVLSAILFMVAFSMSEIRHMTRIFKKAPWYDVVVLISTFLLTIFTDLVIAVIAGVLLALAFVALRVNQTGGLQHRIFDAHSTKALPHKFVSEGVIYTIDGPIFFCVTERIKKALTITSVDSKFIVFRFSNVPFIDVSGLEALREVIKQYKKRGIKVYVCEANQKVSRKLSENGIVESIENFMIFDSLALVAKQYVESIESDE